MAKKTDTFYFESFVKLVDYSLKSAEFLDTVVKNFDNSKMLDLKNQIHKIEHDADIEKHNVTAVLVKEFLPPLDREDILNILRDIDDVTDAIEDVILRMYMYNVSKINDDVIGFTEVIVECSKALKLLMEEFINFRKSKQLAQLISNVLRLEEKCDVLYTNAVRNLYVNEKDPLLINIWSDLYFRLENCCDMCGKVSSSLETSYMKNI